MRMLSDHTSRNMIKPQSYIFAPGYSIVTSYDDLLTLQSAVEDDKQSCAIVHHLKGGRNFSDVQISPEGLEILNSPNAGGNSEKSEAMSYEVLARILGAKLGKTEMNIEYEWSISKRTDYSALIFGKNIGVSVTRAMKYSRGTPSLFTEEDALHLLTKKLNGVNLSSKDVIEPHAWTKQILHVFAVDQHTANMLTKVYNTLSPELKSNTIVLITVATEASWIFTNRD